MKKRFTERFTILGVLLFLMAGVTMGQGLYQFPNADMENWRSGYTSNGDAVPSDWHSFHDSDCGLTIGCGTARSNHSNIVDGWNGDHAMDGPHDGG